MLTRILIFVGILLVVAYAFTQFQRRSGMFFPERYPSGDWNNATAQDETFVTDDGVRLHGWLFRAADPAAPLVVWMHGNGGNIMGRAPMAAELARRGISVFVFDWRGYGKSAGSPTEDGLYHDALAAVDLARGWSKDICVYGESLGGPYAAYSAAQSAAHGRKLRCAVIENSFASLKDLGNELYGPLPLGWFAPRAMATRRWLNEARIPVLVLHGRRDQVIPFPLGKQLFDELKTPKELFVSETAGHCEIPVVEGTRYYEAVVRFVRQATKD
jgi:fermentation-respiration switch protein FrsA (DUF1100 family)